VHYGSVRRNSAGFSLVEVIILISIVIAVGIVGWTVKSHREQQTSAKSYVAGPTKTYTDAAHVYQVRYPAKWTVDHHPAGESDKPNVDPDEPIFLPDDGVKLPCNAAGGCGNNVNPIRVSAIKVGSADDVLKNGWYPVKKETINGYQAYFKQNKYGKLLVDDYFVFHKGVLLDFSFRPVSVDGFRIVTQDTQHTAAYQALVHTVKFLN
jgi:hypothetical protein